MAQEASCYSVALKAAEDGELRLREAVQRAHARVNPKFERILDKPAKRVVAVLERDRIGMFGGNTVIHDQHRDVSCVYIPAHDSVVSWPDLLLTKNHSATVQIQDRRAGRHSQSWRVPHRCESGAVRGSHCLFNDIYVVNTWLRRQDGGDKPADIASPRRDVTRCRWGRGINQQWPKPIKNLRVNWEWHVRQPLSVKLLLR